MIAIHAPWRRWTVLAGAVTLLAGLAAPATASADDVPLADGPRLAFATGRFGDGEIMTMRGDGSALARVTRWGELASEASASAHGPQWSPDGRSILFATFGVLPPFDAGSSIDQIAEDGTDRQTLRSGSQNGFDGTSVSSPRWSPDGNRYLYDGASFSRFSSSSYLTVSDVGAIDGVSSQFGGGFSGSDFSPDGDHVAAVRTTAELGTPTHTELVVYDLDGASDEEIAAASPGAVDWSPDGGRIAFVLDGAVHTIGPDGSDDVSLAPGGDPQWSPDGSRILFTREVDGTTDLFAMDGDGSDVAQLTTAPGDDGEGTWSPDGSQIAFTSVRDGNSEIYVMAADGTGQTNITQSPSGDSNPDWTAGCAEADCGEVGDAPTAPPAVDVVSAVVQLPDISIDFELPTTNGGSRVTGYTVTQHPSGQTLSVAGPEIASGPVVFGTRSVSLSPTNAVGDAPSDDQDVVCAATQPHHYNDVSRVDLVQATSWLWDRAVAGGYADDTFRPRGQVNRAQLAGMLYRVAGSPDVSGLEHGLIDVPGWVDEPVRWAVANGVMTGFPNHTFRPGRTVARGPLAGMLHQLAGSPDPSAYGDHGLTDVPPAVDGAVRWLVGTGLVTGYADHTLRPRVAVQRGQLATMLFRGVCGSPV